MPSPLEALFVSFRKTGRPEPLGELFDRANPQLLAVALHLCPHPADAEDALQATFVAAIDGAGGWDAARPVLPWLLGILTKQCRRIGERRARRREQELPDEPLVLDDGSPVAASERRELVARLREHIDRLPVEQRQVLLLQLEHGLAPAEVAEVLGVPAGTVRMRLHRAVQALRGVLPASLVALLLAALPSRGLAAVRTAVVARAAAAGAVLGGAFALKKFALVAAVIVMLGIGVAMLRPSWWSEGSRDAAPAELQVATVPEAREVQAPAPEPQPRIAVEPTPEAPTVESPAATGSLLVRTLRDDGLPVSNQLFSYCVDEGEMTPVARFALTDRAGEARIDGLAPGPWHVEVLMGGKYWATVTASCVAEVRCIRAAKSDSSRTLRCRVVHADGRPAAGATIVIGAFGPGATGAAAFGLTDAMGRCDVELRGHLGAGARLAGYAPAPVTVCGSRCDLDLVLGGPEAIVNGAIVGPDGAPVRGALVELGPGGGWVSQVGKDDAVMPPSPQIEVTDGEGQCTFRELVAAPLRVRIRAAGYAAYETNLTTVAGEAIAVRWQLEKGRKLEGRVVDEEGRPVKAWVTIGNARLGPCRQCDDDGRFRCDNAPAEAREIHVQARGFVRRTIAQAELDEGAPIVLRAPPHFDLRLVDDARRPLANWELCLSPRRVWGARTDADGRASLAAGAGVPVRVFVSPPGAVYAVLPLPWPPGMQPGVPGEIVVPAALLPDASLRGVIVASDGTPLARAQVDLISPDDLEFARTDAPGGRFDFPRVPSGDWQLRVRRQDHSCWDPPIAVRGLGRGEARDLGPLRAPPDGALRATVRSTTGQQPHGLRFLLFDAHGDDKVGESDGEVHPIPVGRYRWQIFTEDCAWRSGEVAVLEGGTSDLEIVLPPGVRRDLAIQVPAAACAAGQRFVWCLRDADGHVAYRSEDVRIAEDGYLELHPTLSAGSWRVEVTIDGAQRFAGAFEVETGDAAKTSIEVAVTPVK